jgi:hypothetical protein
MLCIRVTPEAKAAIVEQFALLELLEPALFIRHSFASGDVTRSSSGQVKWNIERPETYVLRFSELPSTVDDPEHFLLVDGIRMLILVGGDRSKDDEVELSVHDGKLLIVASSAEPHVDTAASRFVAAVTTTPNRGIPMGLVLREEILGPSGNDRLCLFDIAVDDCGFYFHSLHWQSQVAGKWDTKLCLTQKQFQGKHLFRRWVSKLHSFRPDNGVAVMQVAEGNRPQTPPSSTTFLYSWRAWDLVKNVEVERLKDCDDPFEPLDQ